MLVAHAVTALVIGLGAYADGAWFDFALLTGEPFQLVWRNYPARLMHYLAIYWPATLLLKAHAPPAAALLLARTSWFFAPTASLALCCAFIPKAKRVVALAPAAYFVLAGLLCWGFPTEIWLLAAFAWPAFFALTYATGTLGIAFGAILVLASGLSYELGVAFLPLMIWAAWDRQAPGRCRAVTAALVSSLVCLAVLAIATSLLRPTPDVAADVRLNALGFFNLHWFAVHPALRKDATIMVACIVAAVIAHLRRDWRPPALLLASVAGVMLAVCDLGGDPIARYPVRTLCAVALATAMFMLLWSRRRPPPQLTPEGARTFVIMAAASMGLATTWENGRFAQSWIVYDQAIAKVTDCHLVGRGCRAGAIVDLPAPAGAQWAVWPWGLPYRSMLTAADPQRARLVRDPAGSAPAHARMSCEEARRLTLAGERPPALKAFAKLTCDALDRAQKPML